MSERINFDGALKEFFERRRPSLLMDLTGGVAVKESVNVELPEVRDRKVDLVLRLADDSLLHLEFQSSNRSDMAPANGGILPSSVRTIQTSDPTGGSLCGVSAHAHG